MKSRFFLLIILGGIVAGAFWIVSHQTMLIEKILNCAAERYFFHSLRFDHAEFDSKLKLHVQGARGALQGPEGPYPVEIHSLDSVNAMADLAWKKPVSFTFDGVRLNGSVFQGMNGQMDTGLDGSFRIESRVDGLGLEDLAPLNPQNLKGASGEIRGRIVLEMKPGRDAIVEIELHAQKGGGKIPSRFFSALLPYLPEVQNRAELETIVRIAGVVGFEEGDFKVNSAGPGRMKVFLHMKIPAYNFNLNLNIEIRTDTENLFQAISQLAQVFGAGAS